MSDNQNNEQRLAKYLSWAGIASRRNCEQFIIDGRVTVNGVAVTTPAFNVVPGKDVVLFDGREVDSLGRERVYILLNKPAGYTCSAKDSHAEKLVYELLPDRFGRLFTVGRLDRDSEGMIILTNDGDYAQQLTHPSRRVIKRYYVECDGQFTTSLRRQMMEGMYDNGEYLRALHVDAKSVQRGRCTLLVTLGDGRKREVRRLCKDVGLTVTLLRRVAIGCLELDDSLAVGAWRLMSSAELESATRSPKLPESSIRPDSPEEALPYWQKRRQSEHQDEYPERRSFRREGNAAGRPARRSEGGGEFRDYPERRSFRRDDSAFQRDGNGPRRPFRRLEDAGDFRDYPERRSFRRDSDEGYSESSSSHSAAPRGSMGGRSNFHSAGRPFREEPERRSFRRSEDDFRRDARPARKFEEQDEAPAQRKWYEADEKSDTRSNSREGGVGRKREGGKDDDMRFSRGHKYPRNWR